MSAILTEDQLKIPPAVQRELARGELAGAVARVQNDLRTIAREEAAAGPRRGVDGLGQLELRVPQDLYWQMIRLHGPHCWEDPAFRRRVAAEYPQTRPAYQPRASIVAPGMREGSIA